MDHEPSQDELVKCVVVGDTAVGKTRLICARACDVQVSLKQLVVPHVPTVWAIDQYRNQRQVYERSFQTVDGYKVSLRLWDTFGDHDKDRRFAYGSSDVVLLCFSVSNPASLRHVKLTWFKEIRRFCPNTPIVLVGCKVDMRYLWKDERYLALSTKRGPLIRKVREQDLLTPEQGRAVAKDIGASYYESSAFTLFGVETVFENTIRAALCGRRENRFLMSHLKKIQGPQLQAPFCPPKPDAPKINVPKAGFIEDLRTLYNSKSFCDVIFIAQGVQILAHRFLLAASVQTFFDLFTIDLSDVLPESCRETYPNPSPILCKKFPSDDERLIESDSSSQTDSEISSYRAPGDVGIRKIVNHPAFDELLVRSNTDLGLAGELRLVVVLCRSISAVLFRNCLLYVYTGEVNYAHVDINEMMRVAKLLEMGELFASLQNIYRNEEFLNQPIKEQFQRQQRENLKRLCLQANFFSDITFQLDDGTCCGHRALLMARCDMMGAMLGGAFRESVSKLIKLPDVTKQCFVAFLEYIYTDSLGPVKGFEPVEQITLANRLCLPQLIAIVEEKVVQGLERRLEDGDDISEDLLTLLDPCELHNAVQLRDWCLYTLCILYNELTISKPKCLRTMRPDHLAYVNLNRWPPAWYITELNFYHMCLRANATHRLATLPKRYRSSTGCLCFHKRRSAQRAQSRR